MKRTKRTFTQDERTLVFDLWKQGAGFSDIGRIIEAKPGSVFTILGEVDTACSVTSSTRFFRFGALRLLSINESIPPSSTSS